MRWVSELSTALGGRCAIPISTLSAGNCSIECTFRQRPHDGFIYTPLDSVLVEIDRVSVRLLDVIDVFDC